MSWAEAKWTVDNILQKIGQPPNNMRSFIAYGVSNDSIGLKFLEPEDSYADGNLICSVGGVMIRMSEDGYPSNTSDGTLVINNKDLGAYENDAFIVEGLTEGTTYYFSAFPYSSQGVYNLSSNAANRANAAPTSGEIVTVTINIDDDSAFNSVIVTCVDETDSSLTSSSTLTPSQTTASFVVPIGHTYHIEYGEEEGYSKPSNTVSKVSVEGATTNYEATYYYFTATINVSYPEGATLTCSHGGTTYTASTTVGTYQFRVHEVGTWTINAVDGNESDSTTVAITSDGQVASVELSFAKIYGISRDITSSSPTWARTDLAVDMTVSASVGIVAGDSDFDDVMPWSGITRETLSTGDVMVKIPKFYFRRYREGDIEYIKIADKKKTGFTLHPLFNHGGVEKAYAYIGAYMTSNNNQSITDAPPTVSMTRANFRTNAQSKGDGWGIIDIAAVSAIQMLILVEFATNDVQSAIGRGYCDSNSSTLNSGSCDTVANLTGRASGVDGKTGVVYRGIENFWGSAWEMTDGMNYNNDVYLVCNDISKYADNAINGYRSLGFGNKGWSSNSYITEVGLDEDNTHVMLPSEATGGSENTYYCDMVSASDEWRIFMRGGSKTSGGLCGLFAVLFTYGKISAGSDMGSRLLYIPS